jgi:hypothetical protein
MVVFMLPFHASLKCYGHKPSAPSAKQHSGFPTGFFRACIEGIVDGDGLGLCGGMLRESGPANPIR